MAGAAAAAVSGVPSTVHALLTGTDPLKPSLAAGSLLLGDEQRAGRLLPAAGLVHAAMSLGWAAVLAAVLPARRTALAGALSGVAIAALDRGVVGRRFPRIRTLPLLPQLADHVAYGAVVGAALARRGRWRDADVVSVRALSADPVRVFEFLADLRNHWLEDRFVELRELDPDDRASPQGRRVRLKGPFGVRREARTRVVAAQRPASGQPGRLTGRADLGTATTGRISWQIAADGNSGSLVTLTAITERASLLDRVLLLLGSWWLQQTFDQALANLDRILRRGGNAGDPPVAVPDRASVPRVSKTELARMLTSKRRVTTALARYGVNPVMRKALELGIAPPGYALLETTGRRSGLPRRTPVGNGLSGDTFWIVAEHGRSAAYVRNIKAHPRVRIKVGGSWRSGTAHLLPDDDPRERQRRIGRRVNAAVVGLMGTDLLTIRVDLDPVPAHRSRPGTRRAPGGEDGHREGGIPGHPAVSRRPSGRRHPAPGNPRPTYELP